MAKKKHKKIPKRLLGCPNCTLKFYSLRGLNTHKTRQSHWFEVKPNPPEPIRTHTSFKSLVNCMNNWGRKYTEEERKSPPDNDLIMGYLALIIDKMDELIREVKRPR